MLIDVIGMLGVLQIVVAYFLLQGSFLKSDSYMYSSLNLLGAIFILYTLLYNWNLSSFVIEIIWIIISGLGIWNRFKKNKCNV